MEQTRFANLADWTVERELSLDGSRLELGDGRWILLRQAGGFNRKFDHLLAVRLREAGVADVVDEVDKRVAHERVVIEVTAELLVADWGGFVDSDGQPIPCEPEAALELFENHPPIADLAVTFSYAEGNYRRQADTKSDR